MFILFSLILLGVNSQFEDASNTATAAEVFLEPSNGVDSAINVQYGPLAKCPVGSTASSFLIKIGSTNPHFPKTKGVTGVQVRCNSLPEVKLTSLHTPGLWEKKPDACPANQLLTGVQLRITNEVDTSSDTVRPGVSGIRFLCADALGNSTWLEHSVPLPATLPAVSSAWGEPSICPDLYAIDGLKTTLGTSKNGARLHQVALRCVQRWTACRGCNSHGECILSTLDNGTAVQTCKCAPGWHGDFCTWHINPIVAFAAVVPAGDTALTEGVDLQCNYTLKLDNSTEDKDRTLIQWYRNDDFLTPIANGPILKANRVYAGVVLTCTVTPCDNFPVQACGVAVNSSQALINGAHTHSFVPVGWESIRKDNYYVFISNFTAESSALAAQHCKAIYAKLGVFETPEEAAMILLEQNVPQAWISKTGPNTKCARMTYDPKQALPRPTCTSTVGAAKVVCTRYLNADQIVNLYAFRSQPKNWVQAQAVCQNDYQGTLATQVIDDRIRLDTDVLKQFPSCGGRAWNGATYSFGDDSWPFRTGQRMNDSSMWAPNEPRVNGFDVSRCVTYRIFPQGVRFEIHDCESEVSCFSCEGVFLNVSMTTTEIRLVKTGDLQYVSDQYRVQVLDLAGFILGDTLLRDVEPVKVQPGMEYGIRFLNELDPAIKPVTFPVKSHCDCDRNPTRNGAPTRINATQQNGMVKFSWQDNGACATSWTLYRQDKTTGTLNFVVSANVTANKCSDTPSIMTDPSAFEQLSFFRAGELLRYCVVLNNNVTGYITKPSCINVVVEFFSKLTVKLVYENGDFPVAGASVAYAVKHFSEKNRADIEPRLTGINTTGADGAMDIIIQSDALKSNDLAVSLQLAMTTVRDYDGFVVIGEGDYTGIYPMTHTTGNRPRRASLNLTFMVPKEVTFHDDIPLVQLTGFVSFPKINGVTGFCPAYNATVCYRHHDGIREYCSQTTRAGNYTLWVPRLNVDVYARLDTRGVPGSYARPLNCGKGTPRPTKTGGFPGCFFDIHRSLQPYVNVDFSFSETRDLKISAYGGSGQCKQPIGNARFQIRNQASEECAYYFTGIQTIGSQPYTISIPPIAITVEFIGWDQAPGFDVPLQKDATGFYLLSFPLGYESDLRSVYNGTETVQNWEYHTQIDMEIVRIGDGLETCNGFPVVVGYPNKVPIRIVVRAWENFNSFRCPVTGGVIWKDGLIDPEEGKSYSASCGCYQGCYGDSEGCPITLTIPRGESFGEATIQTIPGRPAAAAPWLRYITLFSNQQGRRRTSVTRGIIITGDGTTPVPYADQIPDVKLPSLMLFDPPGGSSYSYISKGTTLQSEYSVGISGSVGADVSGSFGMSFDIPGISGDKCGGFIVFLCVSSESSITTTLSGSAGFAVSRSSTTSYSASVTLESEITTSKDPGLVDGLGDVIILQVVSLQHLPTYTVYANISQNGSCSIQKKTIGLRWIPNAKGLAIYNMWDVFNMLNRLNYDLELMESLPPTPDWDISKQLEYQNKQMEIKGGIQMWNGIIDYWQKAHSPSTFSAATKLSAAGSKSCAGQFCVPAKDKLWDDIIYFGAGSNLEYSIETENTIIEKQDQKLSLGADIGFYQRFSGFGVTQSFNLAFKSSFSGALSRTTTETVTTKVGFVLNDEDVGDNFVVELWYNRDYSVPMFKLLSGASRCPHEAGTLRRNAIAVTVEQPLRFNQIPEKVVPFGVYIANAAEDYAFENNNGMAFVIRQVQSTNPYGASFIWDGVPVDSEFEMALNSEGEYLLQMRRGDAYNFSGVRFSFIDSCELGLQDQGALGREPYSVPIDLTAVFLQPCASMEWSEGWSKDRKYHFVVNADSQSTEKLRIEVVNPEYPNVLWADNLNFDRVVVYYRHVEMNEFRVAFLDSKALIPAILQESEGGYVSVDLDTSDWIVEGEYEIYIKSTCLHEGVVAPHFVSQQTPVRLGLVDRTPPRVFGFPEPGNGVYLPGNIIGLTFLETIDCNLRNYPGGQFNATIKWDGSKTYSSLKGDNMLFFICEKNQLQITWGLDFDISAIQQKKVTITVSGIRDPAGNVLVSPVTWSFVPSTYEAFAAMIRIDNLVLEGVTPLDFIEAYYKDHHISPEDRIVTDAAEFSSFSVAFCSQFNDIVKATKPRCELLKYASVQNNLVISMAIPPGVPTSAEIFKTFKAAIAAKPAPAKGNTTKNQTEPEPEPQPLPNDRRRAVSSSSLLSGSVSRNSSNTSWDITTDSNVIKSTLKQDVYPVRFWEALSVQPVGFFVTILIGICLGFFVLGVIFLLHKTRDHVYAEPISTNQARILPQSLQGKIQTYDTH